MIRRLPQVLGSGLELEVSILVVLVFGVTAQQVLTLLARSASGRHEEVAKHALGKKIDNLLNMGPYLLSACVSTYNPFLVSLSIKC